MHKMNFFFRKYPTWYFHRVCTVSVCSSAVHVLYDFGCSLLKCSNDVDAFRWNLTQSQSVMMSAWARASNMHWLREYQMQLDKNKVAWSQWVDFSLCEHGCRFAFFAPSIFRMCSDVRLLHLLTYTHCIFVLSTTHLLNVAWKQCLKCFRINLRLFHLSTRTQCKK